MVRRERDLKISNANLVWSQMTWRQQKRAEDTCVTPRLVGNGYWNGNHHQHGLRGLQGNRVLRGESDTRELHHVPGGYHGYLMGKWPTDTKQCTWHRTAHS